MVIKSGYIFSFSMRIATHLICIGMVGSKAKKRRE
jgi:hypothetical protein